MIAASTHIDFVLSCKQINQNRLMLHRILPNIQASIMRRMTNISAKTSMLVLMLKKDFLRRRSALKGLKQTRMALLKIFSNMWDLFKKGTASRKLAGFYHSR